MARRVKNRYGLSQSQERLLLIHPRLAAMFALRQVTEKIQAHLIEQVLEALKRNDYRRAMRKAKRFRVPRKLASEHYRILLKFLQVMYRNGRIVARMRKKKRLSDVLERNPRIKLSKLVRELRTSPEDALASRYKRRAKIHAGWVNKKYREWAGDVSKARFRTTIKRSKEVIGVSIREGYTRSEVRDLLETKFNHYNTYELDRVITTEHTRAINMGTFAEERSDDAVVGWTWHVNYIGCPLCDGYDGMFYAKGNKSNIPPAHPNCECTLEPVYGFDPAGAKYLKTVVEPIKFRPK